MYIVEEKFKFLTLLGNKFILISVFINYVTIIESLVCYIIIIIQTFYLLF